ncbi:unnamed protein product, partial [Vitis vinifera]
MLRQRSRKGPLPPAQEHIDKLEKTVNDGDYYGAQQMYKSISARYASAERCYEALDILESGACIQLEKGQVTCGAELAILFVETLVKGKFPYDDNTLDRVRKIYKNFPQISVPQQLEDDDDMQKLSEALGAAKTRVEVCSSFLKAAMKWSAEFGFHRQGSPEIHDMLAEYLYSESPELKYYLEERVINVELSKIIETEDRNGKRHVVISESKGELVSWVRLGPASVGLFLEGLSQCLRNGEDGRRGGWVAVIEALRREGYWLDEKESDQGVRESCKLYAEVVKGSELRDTTRFRVETKEEETKNNMNRLRQCLISKWSPSSAREEDLASLGWVAARAWGLKGKMGLARLGKGCALLEFEKVEEAKRVLASGERLVGGIQMGLEVWSPKFVCAPEGENRKEAWVRMLGLPISLWVSAILKRMGDACGGFLDVDPLTERKEDLEWARIKVKLPEGVLPSSMEIGVEGEVFVVTLWWKISPEIRKKKGDGRDGCGRQRGEVRGEEEPRAGWRVGENLGAAPKEQRRSEDGTGEQVRQFENWALDMSRISLHFVRGNNPEKFASTLVNFMGKCYPGEDDLAIARAVLMYLSLGNLRDANYLMDEVKKQVESKELDYPESDLTEFIDYLLLTLQRDALPLFNMLRQSYKSSIDREPAFNELLDEIAEKFYGVRRRNPMQGMFGDFFKLMA